MATTSEIYEAFKDDERKARVLVEAFERLEHRIPADVATAGQLETTKLALEKQIEKVRADMHEMDGRLTKEIEQVRAELKTDIEQLRAETHQLHATTIKWMAGMLVLLFAAMVGSMATRAVIARARQGPRQSAETGPTLEIASLRSQ